MRPLFFTTHLQPYAGRVPLISSQAFFAVFPLPRINLLLRSCGENSPLSRSGSLTGRARMLSTFHSAQTCCALTQRLVHTGTTDAQARESHCLSGTSHKADQCCCSSEGSCGVSGRGMYKNVLLTLWEWVHAPTTSCALLTAHVCHAFHDRDLLWVCARTFSDTPRQRAHAFHKHNHYTIHISRDACSMLSMMAVFCGCAVHARGEKQSKTGVPAGSACAATQQGAASADEGPPEQPPTGAPPQLSNLGPTMLLQCSASDLKHNARSPVVHSTVHTAAVPQIDSIACTSGYCS